MKQEGALVAFSQWTYTGFERSRARRSSNKQSSGRLLEYWKGFVRGSRQLTWETCHSQRSTVSGDSVIWSFWHYTTFYSSDQRFTAKIVSAEYWLGWSDSPWSPRTLAAVGSSTAETSSDISIPRWFGVCRDDSQLKLHCFSDASSVGYGSVCYLRVVRGTSRQCKFVLGKSRVSDKNSDDTKTRTSRSCSGYKTSSNDI